MPTMYQRLRGEVERSKRGRRPSGYLRDAAVARRHAKERWYGSQGPASPVRRIDPITGVVIEIIPARPVLGAEQKA